MRIIIVEDDEKIAHNIKILLSEKYQVDISNFVNDGIVRILSNDFDLAIIDWMFPEGSGLDIIKEVREEENKIPILMLTARTQTDDVVKGLGAGADDYLTKPFKNEELLARISSLLRRKETSYQSEIVQFGLLRFNTKQRRVFVNKNEIKLSPREFDLLEYLLRFKNEPVERLTLLSHVWGGSIDELSNTVDVHIRYLRKKLGPTANYIKTVKGVGYLLCKPKEKE